ncbi:MAG: hypothetical protein K9N21_12425 [Deltaproteobacteria bacterium]|nr:hypothetical protein [Deltaproteobacteria bacterium]
MSQTQLINIEKQAAALSLDEHIKLMERLARQLAVKSRKSQLRYDWSALYGLGKGLWAGEDAQVYVNRMREDRC